MYRILSPASATCVTGRIDNISLAFDIYNEITAEEFDGAIVINNHADTMRNRNNLIAKSFYMTAEKLGYEPEGIRLGIKTAVPISRGLGSSASCINAGVMLGYLFSGRTFSKSEVYHTASELFPEDKNLAANLYGGLTITSRSASVTRAAVSADFVFTLVIPDYRIPSSRIEEHLLHDLSHEDYCESSALATLFALGMTSKEPRLIRQSFGYSNIYEPAELVKDLPVLSEISKQAGALGIFICGYDPAAAVISENEENAKKLRNILTKEFPRDIVKSVHVSNTGITFTEE